MADSINLDIGYFDHIKTVRLVGLLGRGAEMLPVRLWCYCGMHPKDNGTLTGFSANDVEAVVLKWWGKRGQAVDALVKTGFLECEGSTYKAHGWDEKNGHITAFHYRAVNAAKVRWEKAKGVECPSNATSNATSIAKQCPTDLPTYRPTYLPTKSGRKNRDEIEIPSDLYHVKQEIMDFLAHRKSIRKPVKPEACGKVWAMIRAIPESERKRAIDYAIGAGYQGIFPPKGGSNANAVGRIVGEAAPKPGKYAMLG